MRSALHTLVMPAGEIRGLTRRTWQCLKEGDHPIGVEAQIRRKLPENRPKLLAQCKDTRCEEVGQRRLDVAELCHMGNEPAALDREDKSGRRLLSPGPVALWALQRIERAVDLDGSQP